MSAVRDRLADLRRNLIAVRGRIMHARERVSLAEQRHAHAISYAGQAALTQADPPPSNAQARKHVMEQAVATSSQVDTTRDYLWEMRRLLDNEVAALEAIRHESQTEWALAQGRGGETAYRAHEVDDV